MKQKLILVDCDGVLLHWEWRFDMWMASHGYKKHSEGAYEIHKCYNIEAAAANQLVAMFNETIFVASIPPLWDAVKYVKKLHEEHGMVFHVITSISDAPEIAEARTKNLVSVFGSSPFYRITCLNPSVSKAVALKQYENSGCFWIEDHIDNFKLGKDLGLRSLLVDQHYNGGLYTEDRVYDWEHIYNTIIEEL